MDTRKRDLLLIAIEWLLLLLSQAVFISTEQYTSYVTIGLVLLLASFITRVLRTHRVLPHTGLEIPWALGLASAAVATWIAYDQPVALLQFYRLLSACVIYYAVVSLPERSLVWPATGLLVFAAGLALYWPISNDFVAEPGKFGLITQLGLLVNRLAPAIPGPFIHSNVAAGTLLAAVPIGAALVAETWRRSWLATGVAAFLTLVVLWGLFMTGSRGAWLGLVAAILAAGLIWAQRRWMAGPSRQAAFWGSIALLGVLALAVVVATGSLDRLVGSIPDPSGSLQSRTYLWKQSLEMARDYPFTGSGLMSYFRGYAIYRLLLHTPYLFHAHNTYLQVLLEQGVLGLIALVWAGIVVALWSWKAFGRASVSIWGWAGLVALLAVSLHGMVDVVFYVTRTLPLIGLLFGYAWFMNALQAAQPAQETETGVKVGRGRLLAGAILILVVLLAVFAFRRPLQATWYANLGAVQQTWVELTRYNPNEFRKLSLDQVRQAGVQDGSLAPALANFARAIEIDPLQRTAVQRQAQIALSTGEYSAALEAMNRLWQAGDRDDVTRLVYGDALVANGQPEPAAEAVRGLTWAHSRMLFEAWYRYWIHQDYRRAADAFIAVLQLDPQTPNIPDLLKQAQDKLK